MPQTTEESLILGIVVIVGLIFGSFATALSYRIPRGKEFVVERSSCTHCGHTLGFFDLFPILSWIFLAGKCRYCKKTIGTKYLFTELAVAALFAVVYIKMGISLTSLILASLSLCIVIMTVIDLEHYIIPDGINIAMFLLGVFYQVVVGAELEQFLIGPVLGFGIGWLLRQLMWVWKKKEGLGMGDVKFFAVAGIFLNAELIITFLFLAGVIGVITAILWRMAGRGERFPFGPALAFALFICLVAPEFHDWWRESIGRLIMGDGQFE